MRSGRFGFVWSPLLLTACAASPWTVRVENARDTEVPLVQCAVIYPGGGSGHSLPLGPRHAAEFAGERMDGAPIVELQLYWLPGKPPMFVRITDLTPSTDGITLRLQDPQRVELKDRRGNDAAQLHVDAAPAR
jgi:hypothetical protein